MAAGHPTHGVWSLGGLAALGAGVLLSVQSRMNGELSAVFAQPLAAALWSFVSGTLLLSVLLGCSRRVRGGVARLRSALRDNEIRWYQCVGGLGGGLFVAAQTYAVPLAGVALFTIGVVGGQTAAALVVDRFGLGPAGRAAVTWPRVGAALLATLGVAIAVGGRVAGVGGTVVLPVVASVLVGALQAAQQATNGRVNMATRNPWSTTWLNFLLGTGILAGLAGVRAATGGVTQLASTAAPWWAWLGALCGIGFVGISSIVVRQLGVLPVLVVMLVGQLAAAAALDALSPATRGHITPLVVVGLLVTMVAAALAGAAARRARLGRSGQPGADDPSDLPVAG